MIKPNRSNVILWNVLLPAREVRPSGVEDVEHGEDGGDVDIGQRNRERVRLPVALHPVTEAARLSAQKLTQAGRKLQLKQKEIKNIENNFDFKVDEILNKSHRCTWVENPGEGIPEVFAKILKGGG